MSLELTAMTEPGDERHFPRTLTAIDALIRAGRTAEASQLAHETIIAMRVSRAQQAELRLIEASISYARGCPEAAITE